MGTVIFEGDSVGRREAQSPHSWPGDTSAVLNDFPVFHSLSNPWGKQKRLPRPQALSKKRISRDLKSPLQTRAGWSQQEAGGVESLSSVLLLEGRRQMGSQEEAMMLGNIGEPGLWLQKVIGEGCWASDWQPAIGWLYPLTILELGGIMFSLPGAPAS